MTKTDSTDTEKAQYQVSLTQSQKWAWLTDILACASLSASAKNLATRLMMHHNTESGQCNPKQATLAAGLGMYRSHVNDLVQELVSAGWITAKRTRGSSLYRLEVDRNVPAPGGEMSANDNIRCPEKQTSDVRKSRHLDVGNSGQQDVRIPRHRTSSRNLNGESRRETPTSKSGTGDAEEFQTIAGLRIPAALLKEWETAYKHDGVIRNIRGAAAWVLEQPNKEQMRALERLLAKKDREAEQQKERDRMQVVAEAKHKALHAAKSSRPAI